MKYEISVVWNALRVHAMEIIDGEREIKLLRK